MLIDRIIYVLRSIGVSGISQAIRFAYLRDKIEKGSASKIVDRLKIETGMLERIKTIPSGVAIKFEHAFVEIVLLTPNMARISWLPGKAPVPYTVVKAEWKEIQTEVFKSDTGIILKGGNINIEVSNEGAIQLLDNSQDVIKRDLSPYRNGEKWTLTSVLSPDEHIYGLGERAGKLNLRNGNYCSWNTDAGGNYSRGADPLYIGTPIYLSITQRGCHLVYHENSYSSSFKIKDTLDATFGGGMLRYYVFTGSLVTIYSELGELIGRPQMPPLWSLGYHQCRWGYKSEKDIREVINGFEEHEFPISAIHLDIDYMDQFKVFSINKKQFPSMKPLSRELNDKGIKIVASINPAVKQDKQNPVYISGIEKDVFCKLPGGNVMRGVSWPGWSVFPDFTQPHARKWWAQQYASLFDQGISGIWHDMNEPASFAAWGEKTFPANTAHAMDGRGGDHREAHNIYGLLMNQAAYEALRSLNPTKRPWIFSRSGWAGLQRYAWNWTGDIESTWIALQQTIPTILGLGISGHAFSGVDIGGFSGNPDAELYTRWFQLATFLPLFRTHSAIGTKPREPWAFGEPTTSITRKFAELRYQLLPYLYTLAYRTCQTGIPPIRPVFWETNPDQSMWDIEDEFLVGESMLVAPVVQPGMHSRKVLLPHGLWYSFWDDKAFQGPCTIEVPAPIETIPIFMRAGTLLPKDVNGDFVIQIYPGNEVATSSNLYFDEGDGYGTSRSDYLTLVSSENELIISWSTQGEYPLPFKVVKFCIHGRKLTKLSIDGTGKSIDDETSFTAEIFQEAIINVN
jgi:alpha-glucosidase